MSTDSNSKNESVADLKDEIENLKKKLNALEKQLQQATSTNTTTTTTATTTTPNTTDKPSSGNRKLNKDEIKRYSRQLIMPQIGTKGQEKLVGSSVLIVGCGGLCSSAAPYLTGAGVGRIGLVDHDTIEINNLHRQIIHSEQKEGINKAVSAKDFINKFNSHVDVITYQEPFTSANALNIIKQYDIVLDCTDNVPSRYLINDACVLSHKPLVSGCAVGVEGQMSVYNYNNGPCYRCVHPKPPLPETVGNCSNSGVLGVVPGVIGCLQALEAIKIAAGFGTVSSGILTLFDGLTSEFHKIKVKKREKCEICGNNRKIHELIDYQAWSGCKMDDKVTPLSLLQPEDHISPQQYQQLLNNSNNSNSNKNNHILIDVRKPIQYEICSLPNSINIPLSELGTQVEHIKQQQLPVYVICRRGNDSQRAVKLLREMGIPNVFNITGGVQEWANSVDKNFPAY